jgi:hypothetical protein
MTALRLAVAFGHLELLKLLFLVGVNANDYTGNGPMPLYAAGATGKRRDGGHAEVVRLLQASPRGSRKRDSVTRLFRRSLIASRACVACTALRDFLVASVENLHRHASIVVLDGP